MSIQILTHTFDNTYVFIINHKHVYEVYIDPNGPSFIEWSVLTGWDIIYDFFFNIFTYRPCYNYNVNPYTYKSHVCSKEIYRTVSGYYIEIGWEKKGFTEDRIYISINSKR